MSNINETISSSTCVVCYKNVEIYSIGMCDHPVCFECSTRMRVLCQQNECPICRQDLPKVVFTKEIKPFDQLQKKSLLDTQYDIYFDTAEIQGKFNDLLTYNCKICRNRPPFNTFNSLKDHMRHEHQLHYCDLCVENLKVFARERRCYTRSDLALHRRKGDLDDKSHKGHPLCEFCDQRYMDNDELYRHLRRDHLFCHFCDADGLHQYYNSYDYLREHFRQKHYLCEEGHCAEEKFTSVFRTDIDLKVHRSSMHSKQLSKAAAKQARTLELEFTLAPRSDNWRENRRGGPMPGPSTSRGPREYNTREYNTREYNTREYNTREYNTREYNTREYNTRESNVSVPTTTVTTFPPERPTFVQQPSVDVQSTEEFPTLGNTTTFVPNTSQPKGRGNITVRSTLMPHRLAVTDENFPALNSDSASAGISKTVNFSLSSSNSMGSNAAQSQKNSTPNVSIQVNHEPNGTVTTRVSGSNIRIRPAQLSINSDFPALGCSEPSTSNTNSTHWKEVLQWTCSKTTPTTTLKSKKTTAPAAAPSPPPIQSGEDFPSLSKSSKSKKQSTLMVVPSWGNSQNSNNTSNLKTTTDMTKGKTKKKKVKQPCSGNNSSGNESSSSKSNVTDVKKQNESSHTSYNAAVKENLQSVSNTSTRNGFDGSKCSNVDSAKEAEQSKKDKKKNKNSDASSCASIVNTDSGTCNSNKAQRKRTELKIDSLSSANNDIHRIDEFPALGNSSKPPGFTNPPPGFGTATAPPPGFCVKYNNLEQLHNSNGLTFTNSSGESYSILPDNGKQSNLHAYTPPPNFQDRNKCLVAKLNEVLTRQDHIEDFRCISGLFRQGACSAEEYYNYCRGVMGTAAFENIFPELLILLPDISKQQELFKLHKKEADNKCKNLELCVTCNQVLKSGSDSESHAASHMLDTNFPALGKSTAPLTKNTWVRK